MAAAAWTVLTAAAVRGAAGDLPTIFFLEHSHEHVPAHALHASLRNTNIETVPAVKPSSLSDMIAGMKPDFQIPEDQAAMHGAFRELSRLASHLEALRRASATLAHENDPATPEPVGLIMDRASFDFEKYWSTAAANGLQDFLAAAPADWQILQLSLVPRADQWDAVARMPLEVPPQLAWTRWTGIPGLHCYAFRASFARYVTRAFYKNAKWQVLRYMMDDHGRVSLAQLVAMGAEGFLFSRAVTYSAVSSPVTFQPPREHQLNAEHTHSGMRLTVEMCARAMLAARWRSWLPVFMAARSDRRKERSEGRDSAHGPARNLHNRTLLPSGAMLRMAKQAAAGPAAAADVSDACETHERGWQAYQAKTASLLKALNSSLGSGLRLRGGMMRGRRMLNPHGRRRLKLNRRRLSQQG